MLNLQIALNYQKKQHPSQTSNIPKVTHYAPGLNRFVARSLKMNKYLIFQSIQPRTEITQTNSEQSRERLIKIHQFISIRENEKLKATKFSTPKTISNSHQFEFNSRHVCMASALALLWCSCQICARRNRDVFYLPILKTLIFPKCQLEIHIFTCRRREKIKLLSFCSYNWFVCYFSIGWFFIYGGFRCFSNMFDVIVS